MGADTKIQWCHHTFNPWRGCTKVSDGCKFCYADTLSKRNPKTLGVWGPNGTRVVASDAAWRDPVKWNRWAEQGVCWVCAGKGQVWWESVDRWVGCDNCKNTGMTLRPYRARVFCASLADVFEAADTMPAASVPIIRAARLRLARLIVACTRLDFLLLTKRPENVMASIEQAALDCQRNDDTCEMLNAWLRGDAPPNVWLGTSVENQEQADKRIPHLLKCPAAVRFLSCEPLLGAIDLIQGSQFHNPAGVFQEHDVVEDVFDQDGECAGGYTIGSQIQNHGIDWVIAGGESGPRARPCNIEWIRSIVAQCKAAGVPAFVKQLGAKAIECRSPNGRTDGHMKFAKPKDGGGLECSFCKPLSLKDKKGGDIAEFPEDLRIRQMPAAPAGVK